MNLTKTPFHFELSTQESQPGRLHDPFVSPFRVGLQPDSSDNVSLLQVSCSPVLTQSDSQEVNHSSEKRFNQDIASSSTKVCENRGLHPWKEDRYKDQAPNQDVQTKHFATRSNKTLCN